MIRSAVAFAASVALITSCGPSQTPPAPADPVINGVNYVGVTVSDLERATAFYSEIMDLETVASDPFTTTPDMAPLAGAPQRSAQTRMLRSVNAQFRLMQFDDVANVSQAPALPVQGPGIAHLCFQGSWLGSQRYERNFR